MCIKKVNIFYVFFFLLTVFSCKRAEQVKPSKHDQLQVYNDVLDELVRNRFYDRYLGKDGVNSLRKKYDYGVSGFFDSINYHDKINKLRLEVESDTTKQKFIRLGVPSTEYFRIFSRLNLCSPSDNPYEIEIQNSLLILSSDLKLVCDSLYSPQSNFTTEDFYSRSFKISTNKNEIGSVYFSKLIFDSSSLRAALYYEFNCDPDCGFGEILILEKDNGRWIIKKTHHLWIS